MRAVLFNNKSKDMYYPELADGVKHFKEEGGNGNMCELVENYGNEREKAGKIKATIETCKELGVEFEKVITKVSEKFHLTYEEAKARVEEYWK
jgi:hypothetical protein